METLTASISEQKLEKELGSLGQGQLFMEFLRRGKRWRGDGEVAREEVPQDDLISGLFNLSRRKVSLPGRFLIFCHCCLQAPGGKG